MSSPCWQSRALGWQSCNSLSRWHSSPPPSCSAPHSGVSVWGCVLPGFGSDSSSRLLKCLTRFLAQSSCSMYICWMNEERNMECLNSCRLPKPRHWTKEGAAGIASLTQQHKGVLECPSSPELLPSRINLGCTKGLNSFLLWLYYLSFFLNPLFLASSWFHLTAPHTQCLLQNKQGQQQHVKNPLVKGWGWTVHLLKSVHGSLIWWLYQEQENCPNVCYFQDVKDRVADAHGVIKDAHGVTGGSSFST